MKFYRNDDSRTTGEFAKRVRRYIPDATADELFDWYYRTGYVNFDKHVAMTIRTLAYYRRKADRLATHPTEQPK